MIAATIDTMTTSQFVWLVVGWSLTWAAIISTIIEDVRSDD